MRVAPEPPKNGFTTLHEASRNGFHGPPKLEDPPKPPFLLDGTEWPSRPRELDTDDDPMTMTKSMKSMDRTTSAAKKKLMAKYNDSMCARIATHKVFENTTMAVIVLNALWIGIDTEWNHQSLEEDGKLPLEPWSILVENFFCTYFTIEVVIRFVAFKEKKSCLYDAWFVFDSILVACMIIETWILPFVTFLMGGGGGGSALAALSPFRLLRLLRLTRMARLMRFVPEMMTLVKGIVAAARSVGFIFIFLVLVVYVFAILFTSQLESREEYPLTPYCSAEAAQGWNQTDGCLLDTEFGEMAQDKFATLGDSMMTLFTQGVLGDNLAEVVQCILDQSVMLMWAFWLFFIVTFATLLNMLIGVLCQVVSNSAQDEAENESVNSLKGTLEDAFVLIDNDSDGMVTELEWEALKSQKNVRKSLATVFKDEHDDDDTRINQRLEQLQQTLFNAGGEEEDDEDDEVLSIDRMTGQPSVMSARTTRRSERTEVGLTLEQFIGKVIEMRPKQAASALDLELLQTQVMRDQEHFKTKLRGIEFGLRRIVGEAAFKRCPYKSPAKGLTKELSINEKGVISENDGLQPIPLLPS